ncbi:MAG TPA: BTAD domain-containing putative transcriptional regulator [Gemmatimonadaceae bacterium]|nr:BTAD domain-containing putative transcriptional regulator [Gemmatimonadaceae bacterium]
MFTTPRLTPRFRLRTFGTLVLAGPEDDTFLGKHGHQHRRLSLLAVLAAAGEKGRSRDQLLALFWPEGAPARARHSLEQLLYAIRTSIDDAVFIGVNPVRLNPDVVASDVGDYQRALAGGDLESAAEAYLGAFLDGFHLNDAPEFERWLDAERSRLHYSYLGALKKLAQQADAKFDHATSVRWWRKLSEADPVSSNNAADYIRALLNAGDHTAALQYAEHYQSVVRRELGTNVGPAIANLVADIRAHTATGRISPGRSQEKSETIRPPMPRAESVANAQETANGLEPNRARGWRIPLAIAASIAAFVIAVATVTHSPSRTAIVGPPAERSVVVLPFSNVSGGQVDGALVDGLSEELIAVLARIPNLRVIGRTSAFAFRNSSLGARRIGDSLGVSHLVEGGVQRAGSRLRVQVRLVDVHDASTRWSETYDRDVNDIFSVQSEIASAIARELDLRIAEGTLARINRGSTRNIAAYELYLRGNDVVLLRNDSGARAGLEYFRQAVSLDPEYAAAYAGMARMHMRIAFGNDTELSRPARLALAEKSALKAVALDDFSGDAHAALSMVRRNNYQLASAEAELKRAVSLEPTNARFREWLALLYAMTNRRGEALLEGRRALELDPLSPTARAEAANALLANGRCDEALAQLDRLKSLRPPLNRGGAIAAQCYARKQMWPEAIASVQRISANAGPRGEAILGYVLARAGETEKARKILARLLDRSRSLNGSAFDVALVYVGLAENDKALAWLNKAVDDRSLGFEWLPAVAEDLSRDARFDGLRTRVGLRKQ